MTGLEKELIESIKKGNSKSFELVFKELFNIAEDRMEMNDLSKEFSEKVKKMNAAWEIWAQK